MGYLKHKSKRARPTSQLQHTQTSHSQHSLAMGNEASTAEAGGSKETKFNVAMSCGGCASACTKILNKIDGKQQRTHCSHSTCLRAWFLFTDGSPRPVHARIAGVEDVKCDVEAKTIVVKGSADAQVMLEALKKWGAATNKSVELAA